MSKRPLDASGGAAPPSDAAAAPPPPKKARTGATPESSTPSGRAETTTSPHVVRAEIKEDGRISVQVFSAARPAAAVTGAAESGVKQAEHTTAYTAFLQMVVDAVDRHKSAECVRRIIEVGKAILIDKRDEFEELETAFGESLSLVLSRSEVSRRRRDREIVRGAMSTAFSSTADTAAQEALTRLVAAEEDAKDEDTAKAARAQLCLQIQQAGQVLVEGLNLRRHAAFLAGSLGGGERAAKDELAFISRLVRMNAAADRWQELNAKAGCTPAEGREKTKLMRDLNEFLAGIEPSARGTPGTKTPRTILGELLVEPIDNYKVLDTDVSAEERTRRTVKNFTIGAGIVEGAIERTIRVGDRVQTRRVTTRSSADFVPHVSQLFSAMLAFNRRDVIEQIRAADATPTFVLRDVASTQIAIMFNAFGGLRTLSDEIKIQIVDSFLTDHVFSADKMGWNRSEAKEGEAKERNISAAERTSLCQSIKEAVEFAGTGFCRLLTEDEATAKAAVKVSPTSLPTSPSARPARVVSPTPSL